MCPPSPQRHIEVLITDISEWDVIWEWGSLQTSSVTVTSYWSRVGLSSNVTGVLIRREKFRHRRRGKMGQVRMDTEIGMMPPQVEAHPGPLEARKGKEQPSPGAFRGSVSPPTPRFWISSFQNCEKISNCCSKSSILWYVFPQR